MSAWASSSCWRGCGSGCPRPGRGSGSGWATTRRSPCPGGATATSVDAIVDGVHFRRGQASLGQIGRKALATALSDLAAMGAEPGEAYVVLGVPPDLDEDGCIELLDGIALAAATGTTLAGGDVTRAPALTVAITVVGHAPSPELLVTRAGARPGRRAGADRGDRRRGRGPAAAGAARAGAGGGRRDGGAAASPPARAPAPASAPGGRWRAPERPR